MWEDPIIEEIHEIRRQVSEECGHDWNRLWEHYRKVQETCGLPIYRGKPKRRPKPHSQSSDPKVGKR